MKGKTLVSIVMPVFNMASYVGDSIQSVLNQSYPYWELIVIDDGSTDNSLEIVELFAEKDKRISFYTQKNHGVAHARNRGVDLSNGEYLVFLDSDDTWANNFLEVMLATIRNDEYGMAFCKYQKVKNQKVIEQTPLSLVGLPNESFADYLLNNQINSYAVMATIYKLNFIQENRIKFTEGCSLGEDFEFVFKVASQAKVAFCSEYLYQYNYREDSAYHSKITYKKMIDRISAYERAYQFVLQRGVIDKEKWLSYISINLNDFRNSLKRSLWKSLHEQQYDEVLKALQLYGRPLMVSSRKYQYLIDRFKLFIINSKNVSLWRIIFSICGLKKKS